MKAKQRLLTLLYLGVLSTVSGWYLDPAPQGPRTYGTYADGRPSRGERRWSDEERHEYWRQQRVQRAQERAYQQGDWEHDRATRPDWVR